MYCPKCGKLNDEGAVFCKHCGASMSQDNTISFDQLNNGNSPMGQLQAEARRATVFGILSIVFGALGGFLCLIFAFINISRVNAVNHMNFFPKDVMEIDAYEEAKHKLYRGRKMSVIGLIIFVVTSILSLILTAILAELGFDILSYLTY